jgi:hypothetical protein
MVGLKSEKVKTRDDVVILLRVLRVLQLTRPSKIGKLTNRKRSVRERKLIDNTQLSINSSFSP